MQLKISIGDEVLSQAESAKLQQDNSQERSHLCGFLENFERGINLISIQQVTHNCVL